MSDIEIVRADPAYRRRALLILFLIVMLMGLAIWRGVPALEDWIRDGLQSGDLGRQRAVCLGFAGLISAVAAAVVASGVRIARMGRTTAERKRFPPLGMRVMRDTRVVSGVAAASLGRTQRALGITLVVLGIALFLMGSYVVVRLWP